MPVRTHDGQVIEAKAVMSTVSHPPGREIKLCVTSTNEVVVIDAQEDLSAELGERFAPGIHFSDL